MHKQGLVLLALLALTACQTMRDHPRTTAFIAGSLVLTAGGALRHNANTDTDRHVPTPTVSCSQGQCR